MALLEEVVSLNALNAVANNIVPVIQARMVANWIGKTIYGRKHATAFQDAFPEIGDSPGIQMRLYPEPDTLKLFIGTRGKVEGGSPLFKQKYFPLAKIKDGVVTEIIPYEEGCECITVEEVQAKIQRIMDYEKKANELRQSLPLMMMHQLHVYM